MTAHVPQGSPGIEQMCRLADVSRAGYYRHWRQSAPRQEETGLRDVIQRLASVNRHYGYRRIGASSMNLAIPSPRIWGIAIGQSCDFFLLQGFIKLSARASNCFYGLAILSD
ncbi:hypothetical protein [Mesorhizobium sp. M0213]|uniref:hypothetical protein n=1 Tax=Mesorhizobium sp. M0213 TaxID=2956917 RepID=UPI003338CC5A